MAVSVDTELSQGVIAFLQRGRAASPRRDRIACAELATTRPAEQLVAEVASMVEESERIPVDWSTLSLGDAGRAAAAEMGARYPQLTPEALDALAWNFSFVWR